MYQLMATIIFGSVGLIVLIIYFNLDLPFEELQKPIMAMILVASVLYFGERQNRFTIKGFSLSKIKNFTKNISRKVHLKTALFSILRYVIFSHQFYFLIYIFNLNIDYQN